jgi:sugar phosphate isomerase/epimerase
MSSSARRVFLQQAAATLALLGARVKPLQAAPKGPEIGLQLFPLDQALRADLPGMLRQIRAIGFTEVEMFYFYGRAPAQLRRLLDAADLRCRSVHVRPQPLAAGMPSLDANLEDMLGRARDLGVRYLVCPGPWIPPAIRASVTAVHGPAAAAAAVERMTVADWRWSAERINGAARRARSYGLSLLYHNGNFEFVRLAGTPGTGYDELLRAFSPEVGLELDCGWVQAAGYDPVHYLQTQRGRVRLAHIKDMTATVPNHAMHIQSIEAGRGLVDWPRLLGALRSAGVSVAYLEQEAPFVRPPLESARESCTYLERVLAGLP